MRCFSTLLVVVLTVLNTLAADFDADVVSRIVGYVNHKENGMTPLHNAVEANDEIAVITLLESGVRPNTPRTNLILKNDRICDQGFTALELAIMKDSGRLTSIFLEYGANPYSFREINCDNRDCSANPVIKCVSAVHLAIEQKRYEALSALVTNKVNFNQTCCSGRNFTEITGFDKAFSSNDLRIIAIIIGR